MDKKFAIITYGCQMNKSDSERIAAVLEKKGFRKSEAEKADLIIINSCSVRQSAEDRVFGLNRVISNLKTQNLKLKIILTGCMNYNDLKILKKKLWAIDEFLEIEDIFKKFGFKKDYLEIEPKTSTNFSAYVPIMTGCDNFCAYCVVPFARGQERSLPWQKIVCETTKLVRGKAKEIILLGQNVNSFQDSISFPELLKKIDLIPGDFWIRFLTSHPKDFSPELMKIIKNSKKIMPYIHLPAQSGSNKILKKMNRKYTAEHYLTLIKKIRKEIPGIAISTDIIVGFPGETKKDFEKSTELFKKARFDMAYINKYSSRPKTAAAKIKDNISLKEKKRREKILTKILEKTALKNNKKYIGRIEKILVEKKKGEKYSGKTATFKNVLFISNRKNLIGEFVLVKIKKALSFGLEGKLMR